MDGPDVPRRRTSLADRVAAGVPEGVDFTPEWAQNFAQHARKMRRMRRLLRSLPADPRCKICNVPFKGVGGRLFRLTGYRASRKSPHLCHVCVESGPPGGFEDDVAVLFGDVRGFTAFAESRSPTEVGRTLERFYDAAAHVVVDHEGIVDKMVGDEVMAIFWPVLMEADPCEAVVDAAHELLHAVGYGGDGDPWLPLGIGVDFGRAYLGNIGGEESRDFTALGDVVNTAARLQGHAAAGEILVTERVYRAVADRFPGAARQELELKGKSEAVAAYALSAAA